MRLPNPVRSLKDVLGDIRCAVRAAEEYQLSSDRAAGAGRLGHVAADDPAISAIPL